jgi:hypothetical protein
MPVNWTVQSYTCLSASSHYVFIHALILVLKTTFARIPPPPSPGRFDSLRGTKPLHCWGFEIILRHTTLGLTPLDEGSVHRRDFYLTAHNKHQRQASVPPTGFQPTIPSSGRSQTHDLDCAATGIGSRYLNLCNKSLRTGQLILLCVLYEVKNISLSDCDIVSATKPLITFSWNSL